jgi:hypothetical protein
VRLRSSVPEPELGATPAGPRSLLPQKVAAQVPAAPGIRCTALTQFGAAVLGAVVGPAPEPEPGATVGPLTDAADLRELFTSQNMTNGLKTVPRAVVAGNGCG